MKSDDVPAWAPAVGAAILTVILGILALVAAGGWDWFAKFLDTAAPAWVQAIGSVAAIVAAILVASDQRRQALDRDKREDAKRIAQLLGLPLAVAERAMAQLRQCVDYARVPTGNIDWGDSADLLKPASVEIARFAALPLQELPYRLFKSAYELLDLLHEAEREAQRITSIRDYETHISQVQLQGFDVAIAKAEIYFLAMSADYIRAEVEAAGREKKYLTDAAKGPNP